jgi:hypothetical protein
MRLPTGTVSRPVLGAKPSPVRPRQVEAEEVTAVIEMTPGLSEGEGTDTAPSDQR